MSDVQPVIIVVDPDADFATALSSFLDSRGYHVVRRSFAIDALQCVAEDRPALVLSEADLPDCDCRELLTSIRAISPSTQVLFMARQEKAQPGGVEGIAKAVDRLLERASA